MRITNDYYRAEVNRRHRNTVLQRFRTAVEDAISSGLDYHDLIAITNEIWNRDGDKSD